MGSGKFDLGWFLQGDLSGGMTGGRLDYKHRLNKSWSAYAHGAAGYGWGKQSGLSYGAQIGLRGRF